MNKPAKKPSYVMVTFGVRDTRLEKEFRRLVKKTELSDAGQVRELMREALAARRQKNRK